MAEKIHEIQGHTVQSEPPFLFHLAQTGIKWNIRGAWKFLFFLQRTALRKCVVGYRFDGVRPITLYVPLFRHESSMPKEQFNAYDAGLVQEVENILQKNPGTQSRDIWVVDAGADIGTVSAQILRYIDGVEKVFAFEPNSAARPYLAAMLETSGVEHTVSDKAVGDQIAIGKMTSPPDDPSEHARFFQPADDGDISMTTISSLPTPNGKTVLIKIDVEGGEESVVRGASDFLKAADDYIVICEAHPKVIARTGQTPDGLIKILSSIKPCRVFLEGHPDIVFDLSKPVCQQIPDFTAANHNLICTSL